MGNSYSNSGSGDEDSYVTGDIRSDGNGREPRPDTELANNDIEDEDEQETNRKSHAMRRAPEPLLSYTIPGVEILN